MFRISKCPQGKAELLTSEFPMSLQIFCWQHVTILLVFGCFKILEIFLFSTLHLSSLGLKKLGKSELFKVQYLHDSNLLLYSISYYRFGSFKQPIRFQAPSNQRQILVTFVSFPDFFISQTLEKKIENCVNFCFFYNFPFHLTCIYY